MEDYILPSIDILNSFETLRDDNEIENYKNKIEKLLNDYKVKGKVISFSDGPISLQFEIELSPKEKVDKLLDLEKEFRLFLGSPKIKIEGPRNNKTTIGIKIPNPNKYDVSFKEIIEEEYNKLLKMNIPFVLGKKDTGENIIGDLSELQHLLIGGSTGSGKSVLINEIICSLLMLTKPKNVKAVLIDPSKVELMPYYNIPHLMCPIVSNPKIAANILVKAVQEMNDRYNIFKNSKTKSIDSYNKYVEKYNLNNKENPIDKMAYIVVIIDELSDLILVSPKEVEDSLYKLVQYGDECGIHIIVSTQRPDNTLISNKLKENFNSRVCFQVRTKDESKIVLDEIGAEEIETRGECIYKPLYGEKILAKVAKVQDSEIKKIVENTAKQKKEDYYEKFMSLEKTSIIEEATEEELYNEIVEYVVTTGKASASLIQRKFNLGYNKAAQIVDILEERGIIGPANGSKPREVLVTIDKSNNIKKLNYCFNCGEKLIHDTKYCINCGAKLK